MSKPNIGRLLATDETFTRDAIHVPILPVVAGEALSPGLKISVTQVVGNYVARIENDPKKVLGVVDPFLSGTIKKGDLFYCFVKPETTFRLWHDWTHPKVK